MRPPRPNDYFKIVTFGAYWSPRAGQFIKIISKAQLLMRLGARKEQDYPHDMLGFEVIDQEGRVGERPAYNSLRSEVASPMVDGFYEMVVCQKHFGVDEIRKMNAHKVMIASDAIDIALMKKMTST